MLQPLVRILASVCLLIAAQAAGQAETPEEVQQRLELYRQVEAERERQRQETLEWQERRRAEDYARKWKRYCADEVNVLSWKKHQDGTWVADIKVNQRPNPTLVYSHPSTQSLSTYSDRLWVKVRKDADIEQLASQLAIDENRLARLNEVSADHQFCKGDWLVLPSQSSKRAKQLAAIDTSELRRSPPLPALSALEDKSPVQFGDPLLSAPLRPTSDQLGGVAPRRFDQALDDLVREGVVSPMERARIQGGGGAMHSSAEQIAVNCTSLMVNRKVAYKDWGKWLRPEPGSPHEQLVIDRCATQSGTAGET